MCLEYTLSMQWIVILIRNKRQNDQDKITSSFRAGISITGYHHLSLMNQALAINTTKNKPAANQHAGPTPVLTMT